MLLLGGTLLRVVHILARTVPSQETSECTPTRASPAAIMC